MEMNSLEIFCNNMSTFKDTSFDKAAFLRSKNNKRKDDSGKVSDCKKEYYMTLSEIEVIDFDGVIANYASSLGIGEHRPCSSDALYKDEMGQFYFVEFKNGKMKMSTQYNVMEKIYNDLLIFCDIMGQTVSFCRENVNFILVYNESKNLSEETKELDKIDQESSKTKIAKHFTKKAKKKFIRFDLGKFEGLYFKEVFTFTEKEFEKEFLSKIHS